MEWKLTVDEIPETNKNQVLGKVLCKIQDDGKEHFVYMVLFPPERKGGVWYSMNNGNPEEFMEIPDVRVKAWTKIVHSEYINQKIEIDWRDDFPEAIWKYCNYDIGLEIIKNLTLKFTKPSDFNDPFDCNMDGVYYDVTKASQEVEQEIEVLQTIAKESTGRNLSIDRLNEYYAYSQMQKLDSIVVTCFSLNKNNSLMWAHYANDHKGMCFEFDLSLGFDNIFPQMKLAAEGKVFYNWPSKVNYCEDKKSGIAKAFISKNEDWQYEEEYRFVCFNEPNIYTFQKKFLKSITFGLRNTNESIAKAIELCRENDLTNIRFKRAVKNKMKIDFEELNISKF